MLGGREGAGWWAWEHSPGRKRLEGAVGDWRPDLGNRSAENNSLGFNILKTRNAQMSIKSLFVHKIDVPSPPGGVNQI